ncbi:hypothetical protein BGZ76_004070 [Entomortierella beljakovae]|nr:hypothetical protein BGZ76_004070 [Entomortierella beljakovae]
MVILRSTAALLATAVISTFISSSSAAPASTASQYAINTTKLPGLDAALTALPQWSGLLPVGGNNTLFFWYVQAAKVESNKLIFWHNGGPGCSSMEGLFDENGPYISTNKGLNWTMNPSSWHNMGHVVYIDQPFGTGLSASTNGTSVPTEDFIGDTMVQFYLNFFAAFPETKTKDMYITGESYAGRYIPYMAKHVLDYNAQNPSTAINLKSIAIGNAYIDTFVNNDVINFLPFLEEQPWIYGNNQTWFNNAQTLVDQMKTIPNCANAQTDPLVSTDCAAKYQEFFRTMPYPVNYPLSLTCTSQGYPMYYNPYNVGSTNCDEARTDVSEEKSSFEYLLNTPGVQDAIHVSPSVFFQGCVSIRGGIYTYRNDPSIVPKYFIGDLIDRGLKVTLYSGLMDSVVPHTLTEAAISDMTWGGKAGFSSKSMLPIMTGNPSKQTGSYQSERGMSYYTITNAGHMVPRDDGVTALWMIKQIVNGEGAEVVDGDNGGNGKSEALVYTLFSATTAAPDNSKTLRRLKRECRCLLSQPCWPTQDQWSGLSQSVGGRLIPTKPVAYECHKPHYDSAKCEEIKKGYFFDSWRQLQPGAVQQANFEVFDNRGCLGVNQTTPCDQGAVPLYTINATSIQDVQIAIRFVSKYNIRLVVKNTGHDYLGRSIGAHSLNLWVYFMKNIKFDHSYVPEGAPSGVSGTGAVVLESGVLWKDVNKAANEHGVIVVGGADSTVGASGGYCQGGGHSPLSQRHGLCVDNVLQYKVVTADGEVRIANSYQNTDLFWALRGGGGGTFGVVVEAVYKTHPSLKNINYAEYHISFSTTEASRKILNNFYSHQIRWSEEGWGGYTYIKTNFIMVKYHWPDSEHNKAVESMMHFIEYIKALEGVHVEGSVREFSTYWDYFQVFVPPADKPNSGSNILISSRLVPRSNYESPKSISELIEASFEIFKNNGGYFFLLLVAGGEVSNGNSKDTSVLPAWRGALVHTLLLSSWEDWTPLKDQQAIARQLTSTAEGLRRLTPGSGSYMNEADINEPNWQSSFFGDNYPRLKSIKDDIDPHGLFVCRNCVGSEDWRNDFTCPSHIRH